MDNLLKREKGYVTLSYTLPKVPEESFEIEFIESEEVGLCDQINPLLPFADNEIIYESSIINSRRLTFGEHTKEIFLIELPSHGRSYEPGDTIGIIPCNPDDDLKQIFKQLKIDHLVHKKCRITQKNGDIKLNIRPVYIDQVTTLYEIFRNNVDIRCVPKKSLIRLMAEYTKNENERILLEELCNKDSRKYNEQILFSKKTLADLLISVPTCCLPVVRLLENLPALLPRPYSIASSPLSSPETIKIVFTVAYSELNGLVKEGICTGMLKSIIHQKVPESGTHSLKIFYRKSNGFRLPKDDKSPLILIGPGSGVSPFIGFLEHRKEKKTKGIAWLFYGCRYKYADYLFKKELEEYVECGALTKLIVSFSREPGQNAKYVQDNIRNYGKEICDMIFDKGAVIYVCGDAKGLRKDVMNAFLDIIQQYREHSAEAARRFLKTLEKERRYLNDVWT